MSDLISREAAINALSCVNPTEPYLDYDDAVNAIKGVTDAIIHCKDCENFKQQNNSFWCGNGAFIRETVTPDHYCGYAKRRD